MKCDMCDNCTKRGVCIYRDNSEICGEDYHEFVADFNVLEQIRAEIEDCKQYQFETYGIQRYFKIDDIRQIINKYMK